MALPETGNSISFAQIEQEFGQNGTRSLGDYRITQTVGEMNNLPLDEGIPQSVAVGTSSISFGDFHSKRLNIVINYSGDQGRPPSGKTIYNDNGQGSEGIDVTVIGGFIAERPASSSGKKVTLHVSGRVHGSGSNARNKCSLRTGGGWETGTILNLNVGSEGTIIGAGGSGGKGGRPEIEEGAGFDGEDGSSALGVAYSLTELRVQTGGRIVAGGGGGGGGGGARGEGFPESDERVGGAGGGGGHGYPGGTGGLGGTNSGDRNGSDLLSEEAAERAYANVEYQPQNGGNGSETNGGNGGRGGANNEGNDDNFSEEDQGSAQSGGGGGGGSAESSAECGSGGGDYTGYSEEAEESLVQIGQGGSVDNPAQNGSTEKGGNGGQADAEGSNQIRGSGGTGGNNGYAIITKSGVVISNTVGPNRIKGDILPNTDFS